MVVQIRVRCVTSPPSRADGFTLVSVLTSSRFGAYLESRTLQNRYAGLLFRRMPEHDTAIQLSLAPITAVMSGYVIIPGTPWTAALNQIGAVTQWTCIWWNPWVRVIHRLFEMHEIKLLIKLKSYEFIVVSSA